MVYWGFDPFREWERAQQQMQPQTAPSFPLVNMYESEEELKVVAELPGAKKDDVTLTMEDNVLTISGARSRQSAGEKAALLRSERCCGQFEKSIRMPAGVNADAIQADFSNGVLTVTLPKAEEAKPRKIAIS